MFNNLILTAETAIAKTMLEDLRARFGDGTRLIDHSGAKAYLQGLGLSAEDAFSMCAKIWQNGVDMDGETELSEYESREDCMTDCVGNQGMSLSEASRACEELAKSADWSSETVGKSLEGADAEVVRMGYVQKNAEQGYVVRVPRALVAKVCPSCANKMAAANMTALKVRINPEDEALAKAFAAKAQEEPDFSPGHKSAEEREQEGGFFRYCMGHIAQDSEEEQRKGLCASLHHKYLGRWPGQDKKENGVTKNASSVPESQRTAEIGERFTMNNNANQSGPSILGKALGLAHAVNHLAKAGTDGAELKKSATTEQAKFFAAPSLKTSLGSMLTSSVMRKSVLAPACPACANPLRYEDGKDAYVCDSCGKRGTNGPAGVTAKSNVGPQNAEADCCERCGALGKPCGCKGDCNCDAGCDCGCAGDQKNPGYVQKAKKNPFKKKVFTKKHVKQPNQAQDAEQAQPDKTKKLLDAALENMQQEQAAGDVAEQPASKPVKPNKAQLLEPEQEELEQEELEQEEPEQEELEQEEPEQEEPEQEEPEQEEPEQEEPEQEEPKNLEPEQGGGAQQEAPVSRKQLPPQQAEKPGKAKKKVGVKARLNDVAWSALSALQEAQQTDDFDALTTTVVGQLRAVREAASAEGRDDVLQVLPSEKLLNEIEASASNPRIRDRALVRAETEGFGVLADILDRSDSNLAISQLVSTLQKALQSP